MKNRRPSRKCKHCVERLKSERDLATGICRIDRVAQPVLDAIDEAIAAEGGKLSKWEIEELAEQLLEEILSQVDNTKLPAGSLVAEWCK